ncbi:ankyrin repeat domain-containing protein [Aureliella helgolandensis]|uniref:Phosphocholine transferase AnkX n=1 Tax=Aureliella helgolandensis TaxID=2527968 RepID=A0A518GAF9_9BACT|nr:ankyrin repeat domain-containing protein [Aureliella helgolandensis]QDV25588.1 Phosphocholine transferase AnkX [Aureliella helgolandensis]
MNRNRTVICLCGYLLVWCSIRPASAPAFQQESGSSVSPATLPDLAEHQRWTDVASQLAQGEPPTATQPDGTTALHWAVFHNHPEAIQLLLATSADVNAETHYQVTPLSLACEFGYPRCAELLVQAGADVERARLGEVTPLMLAARNGNAEILASLLLAGAKVDAREVDGQTALMWAAERGNVDAVDALLHADADFDYRLRGSGYSAFMFAARNGHADATLRFLDAGMGVNAMVNPNRKGGRNPRRGMSALMLAIESGHLELALQLVARGADPNDQRSGFSPLHAITWVRKTELGDNPAGDPPPRITGAVDSLSFVRKMVAAGAEVNLQLSRGAAGKAKLNPKGATPFLLAAKTADVPLLNLLLELGADPTLTNADGTTALMAAAGVGVVSVGEEPGTPEEVNSVIRMLAKLGIDPNVVDRNQESAMHGAAYRNFPSTVAVLTELGASPTHWNHKNKYGWTPHLIASGKRPGSVKPSPETIAALDVALQSP